MFHDPFCLCCALLWASAEPRTVLLFPVTLPLAQHVATRCVDCRDATPQWLCIVTPLPSASPAARPYLLRSAPPRAPGCLPVRPALALPAICRPAASLPACRRAVVALKSFLRSLPIHSSAHVSLSPPHVCSNAPNLGAPAIAEVLATAVLRSNAAASCPPWPRWVHPLLPGPRQAPQAAGSISSSTLTSGATHCMLPAAAELLAFMRAAAQQPRLEACVVIAYLRLAIRLSRATPRGRVMSSSHRHAGAVKGAPLPEDEKQTVREHSQHPEPSCPVPYAACMS